MVVSEDSKLEKVKTQVFVLKQILSPIILTAVEDTCSESPQRHAVDPNDKSKPQFEKYGSFCHKNNHSVSCYSYLLLPI